MKIPIHVVFCLLIALSLLPFPRQKFDLYATDHHRAALCLDAALYKYGSNLVPVSDIFSQYGVGQGALCRFALADTLLETLTRLSFLTAVPRIIFLISLYFLSLLLFRSLVVSVLLTSVVWATQIFVYSGVESFFRTPSLGAYRYFLLPAAAIFLYYLSNANSQRRRLGALFGLGATLGASVFFASDAGLSGLIAVAGAIVFGVSDPWPRRFLLAAQTALIALFSFLALGLSFYGLSFLHQDFTVSSDYLRIYSAGFGAIPQAWDLTLNAITKNHFSNILILFTLGWFLHCSQSSIKSVFLFLCAFGIVLKFKYINRSLDPYFWCDGFVFIVCLFYWLDTLIRSLKVRLSTPFAYQGLYAILAVIFLILWFAVGPSSYGHQWGWSAYKQMSPHLFIPHLLVDGVLPPTRVVKKLYTDESDVQMVHAHVPAGQRALILADNDWVYLLEAKRAPGQFFLPIVDSFLKSSYKQVAKALESTPVVFLDKKTDFLLYQKKEYIDLIQPILKSQFEPCGESLNLLVLCRRV